MLLRDGEHIEVRKANSAMELGQPTPEGVEQLFLQQPRRFLVSERTCGQAPDTRNKTKSGVAQPAKDPSWIGMAVNPTQETPPSFRLAPAGGSGKI
jgi:hypothetical protein